jgi:hypothetical protein
MHFKRSAPVGDAECRRPGWDPRRRWWGAADQICMARDVATMFEDLPAMADRYAELHAERARLQAELEREALN